MRVRIIGQAGKAARHEPKPDQTMKQRAAYCPNCNPEKEGRGNCWTVRMADNGEEIVNVWECNNCGHQRPHVYRQTAKRKALRATFEALLAEAQA